MVGFQLKRQKLTTFSIKNPITTLRLCSQRAILKSGNKNGYNGKRIVRLSPLQPKGIDRLHRRIYSIYKLGIKTYIINFILFIFIFIDRVHKASFLKNNFLWVVENYSVILKIYSVFFFKIIIKDNQIKKNCNTKKWNS